MQSESGNVCRRILIFKTTGGKQQRWYERINRAGREREISSSQPSLKCCLYNMENGSRKPPLYLLLILSRLSVMIHRIYEHNEDFPITTNHNNRLNPQPTNLFFFHLRIFAWRRSVYLLLRALLNQVVLTLFIFFASR